jgi:hypothetical protein
MQASAPAIHAPISIFVQYTAFSGEFCRAQCPGRICACDTVSTFWLYRFDCIRCTPVTRCGFTALPRSARLSMHMHTSHNPQRVRCSMLSLLFIMFITSITRHLINHNPFHSSFKCPVTWSMTLFGAGPIPKTVALPLAICVRPASWMMCATSPRLNACACNSSSSSSLLTCNATFA